MTDTTEGETCQRCGRAHSSWFAPSPLWNAVMRGGSINGPWEYGELICACCFMEIAEERGVASVWRVSAKEVNVPLETVTPSGRVWSEDLDLWVEPKEANMIDQDTAAITVPLDLFKRLVELAEHAPYSKERYDVFVAARREIEQVEALLASPLE